MTVCMVTMAVALPAVMGRVNRPARRAQAGVVLQGIGWALLLLSGLTVAGLARRSAALDAGHGRNRRRPGAQRRRLRSLVRTQRQQPLAVAHRRRHAARLLPRLLELSVPGRLGQRPADAADGAAGGDACARKPAVEVGRWRWLLVVSLVAQMVVTLGRGILGAFFTESYPTFLAPHPVNFAFAVIANATTVLSLMAVLLAHRDEAARELERLATVDGLTGVLNRRAWMSRAATELAVSVRYGVSGGGADDRPRPLQADQRQPRPRRRRPGAGVRRPRPAKRRCVPATWSAATAARSSAC